MTKPESARPQPFMPDHNINEACPLQEAVSKDCFNIRGFSDSAVPICRATERNDQKSHALAVRLQNVLASTARELVNGSAHTVKTRRTFQLPSFHALGIASRHQEAPLTPPDEGTVELQGLALPALMSRTSSFPPSNMLKYSVPENAQVLALAVNNLPNADASEYAPSATPTVQPESKEKGKEDDGEGPRSSSGDEDDLPHDQARWLLEAADAVVSNIDFNTVGTVISLLCHTQPCPLPNETVNATSWPYVTSAFDLIVAAIQNKIDTVGFYIDIAHAVPLKFNMAQIPTSPATTPNLQYHGTGYFDVNVFSKAVVAVDHQQETPNTSIPSSPRPIVAPSSINVSLLERYIPPSSAEEYLNLFTTDGPSVVVNRLVELSPKSGSLMFIYPTGAGAQTFATTYLGPLLHPLLRTMVSIHNLSMDFGAGVGKIAAVDQMLPFENMTRRLQTLLRKLSRGTSAIQRPSPKFALIESSKRVVQLDRRVWTEWWVQQEMGRIRTVVERYLQRGVRMPATKDATAATLVQEVLDGVRTRKYAEYDVEREGIEVGVFVIKRNA